MTISSDDGAASFRAPILYLKLTLAALAWSGTFIAGRLIAESVPPLPAAAMRFGLAALLLVLLLMREQGGLRRPSRAQLLATAALGVTGVFLYNLLFFGALAEMPASRTALFVALNPIVVAVMVATILGQRFSVLKWCAILIALFGTLIVVTRGDLWATVTDVASVFGLGEVLMMSAVLAWAAYTVIGRFALKGMSPLAATTYAALWGFGFLVLALFLDPEPLQQMRPDIGDFIAIAYLAVGGTVVPFVWYAQGVGQIGPARTAIFTNLVPVFGVVLGVLLLREAPSLSALLGGALVLLGVALANRERA